MFSVTKSDGIAVYSICTPYTPLLPSLPLTSVASLVLLLTTSVASPALVLIAVVVSSALFLITVVVSSALLLTSAWVLAIVSVVLCATASRAARVFTVRLEAMDVVAVREFVVVSFTEAVRLEV